MEAHFLLSANTRAMVTIVLRIKGIVLITMLDVER
jgi:hypothetical protein